MKARWISIPAAALMIISAGAVLTDHARAAEPLLTNEALAKKSGCIVCHSVDKKGIGPSYRDIAAKYKADANARAALIQTIKNGGKGKWPVGDGGGLMPPYSRLLSAADIERLVDWVLRL